MKSYGRGVSANHRKKGNEDYPKFETYREQIDGKYLRFPTYTTANLALHFKDYDVRLRETVRYEDYKQFKAQSTIKFGDAEDDKKDTAPPKKPRPCHERTSPGTACWRGRSLPTCISAACRRSRDRNCPPGRRCQGMRGRGRSLHRLGVVCGIAAGAWLGLAEAPTKLVNSRALALPHFSRDGRGSLRRAVDRSP